MSWSSEVVIISLLCHLQPRPAVPPACTRNIVSGAIFCGAFNYPGVKHIDPTAGQSPSVSGSWEHFEVVSLNFSPSADGHLAHDGQSNIGTCEANDQKSVLLEQIVSSHSVWHLIFCTFGKFFFFFPLTLNSLDLPQVSILIAHFC